LQGGLGLDDRLRLQPGLIERNVLAIDVARVDPADRPVVGVDDEHGALVGRAQDRQDLRSRGADGSGRPVTQLLDQAARALDTLSRRGEFTADDDRVFGDETGAVLSQDALRPRYRRALERAGLKPLRFHDLRHTFGTLAVQAFPLSDVKAYMGHANIETTMLYVHHVPQHDAADKLSALVAAAENVDPTVDRTGVMRP